MTGSFGILEVCACVRMLEGSLQHINETVLILYEKKVLKHLIHSNSLLNCKETSTHLINFIQIKSQNS